MCLSNLNGDTKIQLLGEVFTCSLGKLSNGAYNEAHFLKGSILETYPRNLLLFLIFHYHYIRNFYILQVKIEMKRLRFSIVASAMKWIFMVT